MNDLIKDTIQDCNINFLLGSGVSTPFLKTLGNIETLLSELENTTLPAEQKTLIRASLYLSYFSGVINRNLDILGAAPESKEVLGNYHAFLRIWNSILLKRKSTILGKEVNIFTTNVDIFLDKALEDLGLEYNDGFNGRFNPSFSLSNFKKSRFKKSLHYDNISEMPVFNLLKLHGSLCWDLDKNDGIIFSRELARVIATVKQLVSPDLVLNIANNSTMAHLSAEAAEMQVDGSVHAFLASYDDLLIVNPTKDKFKHTLLNQTYYELLRLYSNELEKENTVLFVIGFSFADEHICEITLRAANSNPTLKIFVIAHSSTAKEEIEARFGANHTKNDNIVFMSPTHREKLDAGATDLDAFKYDLATINKRIFAELLRDEDV